MMRFYDAGGVSRRMSSTEAVTTMVLGDAASFVELDPARLAGDFAIAQQNRPKLRKPATIRKSFRDAPIGRALQAHVFERAGGLCEYCGVAVFDTAVIAEAMLRSGISLQRNTSSKPDLAVTRNARGVAVLRQSTLDGSPSRNASLAPETEGAVLNSLARYDHVIPWSVGGTSSPENVALCCKPCNSLKANFWLRQLEIDPPPWFVPELPATTVAHALGCLCQSCRPSWMDSDGEPVYRYDKELEAEADRPNKQSG